MPEPDAKHSDLNGSAPDHSPVALLLIDVINALDFPEGERVREQALPMARALAALKRRAREEGIPTVYVNDNWGRWQSDFARTVEHVLREGSRGREVARLLRPDPDDYFVLKPKQSGFYSSTLETLLEHLGARTLILGGIATNMCVLFTAADAHMRDFRVVVPRDCVAAASESAGEEGLRLMRAALGADTTPSPELDLAALRDGAG